MAPTGILARQHYEELSRLLGNFGIKCELLTGGMRVTEKRKVVELTSKLSDRSVNEGFSGGEKKRNEIFQMAVLEPELAILDETDSGLDIDALRIVANGVNQLKSKDNATVVITHYQRLLDYIVPDVVHVLFDGKIVKSGPKELALELEEKGYDWIKTEYEQGLIK
jgi:Fe-S cluster assembly ATP-binding protein